MSDNMKAKACSMCGCEFMTNQHGKTPVCLLCQTLPESGVKPTPFRESMRDSLLRQLETTESIACGFAFDQGAAWSKQRDGFQKKLERKVRGRTKGGAGFVSVERLEEVERERDAKWWECQDCCFRFAAEHVTQATGNHDCPNCAETRLEAQLATVQTEAAAMRLALERIARSFHEREGAMDGQGHGLCIDIALAALSSNAGRPILEALESARKALEAVDAWAHDPDENANERFERIAAWFYRETGYLRPGKDESAALGDRSIERNDAWLKWCAAQSREMRAAAKDALAQIAALGLGGKS